MGKTMLYGDNLDNKLVKFGLGKYDSATVNAILNKDDSDSKVRFVYGADAGENADGGLIFVGNKLVSSKVLDITTNAGVNEDGSEKLATKVTVKWYGEVDGKVGIQETEFDITSPTEFGEITDFLKEGKVVTPSVDTDGNANGAVTIEPVGGDDDFKSYTVKVNVDEDPESTIAIVNDKLTGAKYSIKKVETPDEQFSAQYQLMQTLPGATEATAVGDTINIIKDFLVQSAHVCSYKYADATGTVLNYDNLPDGWTTAVKAGDDVIEGELPYAKLADGTFEEAKLNQGIKYGHTYLHLVMNTRPAEDDPKADTEISDVYLDFTDIFETFTGDEQFITVGEDGKISLEPDAVTEYVDTSLGITDHFKQLDSSVNDIEDSYLTKIELTKPSEDITQFDSVQVTQSESGQLTTVNVNIANQTFYDALQTVLDTLGDNDVALQEQLTWEDLA